MNIERYITTWPDGVLQRGECFPVLDMYACLQYHTAESAGFSIDRVSKSGFVHAVKGQLDVHHPCAEHNKTRIRCNLPAKYLDTEHIQQALLQIFAALDIPADETYDAWFCAAEQGQGIIQDTDREGYSEWI